MKLYNLLIIIVSLSLTSCVGINAVYPSKSKSILEEPGINKTYIKHEKEKSNGYKWLGIIITPIIPIPLIIPVGKETRADIIDKNNEIIGLETNRTHSTGFLCYFSFCSTELTVGSVLFELLAE